MSKSDASDPDFEDVLHTTGYFGRYNFLQGSLHMAVGFSVAFPLLSIVFTGYGVPHTCRALPNTTMHQGINIDTISAVEYGECSIRLVNNVSGRVTEDHLPCVAGYNYSRPREISFVAEWDLVCDRTGYGELSQTMMMLGQGFGGLIFTSISDKYGRKPIYIGTLYGLGALAFGMAFSPNVIGYIIIRFFIGAFQQGAGLTAYTLFVESLSTDHRIYPGTIGGIVWSMSVMTMAPIAYAMQDYSWRYLQIVLSCASLYVFFLHCAMDESFRWLVANNKMDIARKNTKKATRMNRCDVAKVLKIFDKVVKNGELEKTIKPGRELKSPVVDEDGKHLINGEDAFAIKEKENQSIQYSVLDIFRHKTILKTSAITWYIWTVNSLTYYGLFLTSTSLAGNRFLNFFLSSIVEVPGTLSVFFMLKKVGRKKVSMLYHFMTAVSLVISVIILTTAGETRAGSIAATVFNLLGKFSITGSFNALFIYCPELFPTNLRTAGLGMGSAMSRFGGMSAPYSRLLAETVIWGPGAIFGALCFIATFLIRYLPETKGRVLPTTIDEVKDMYATKKTKNVPN